MSEFAPALAFCLRHEGGYNNDPDDAGGETYRGLERRDDGDWDGWSLVDAHKAAAGRDLQLLDKLLAADTELQRSLAEYYRPKYWRFAPIANQLVADKCFDSAVQFGPQRAIRMLQRSLRALGLPVGVDGKLGSCTIHAANVAPVEMLLASLVKACEARYREVLAKVPKDEPFRKGWMRRADDIEQSQAAGV